jgi:hypothetical protein
VVGGSTLTTYNVDPKTLQATQVGTTTITQSEIPELLTSPDGRFLYYFANQGYDNPDNNLYVYQTDGSGLPGGSPVQKLAAKHLYAMTMYRNGKFLYEVTVGSLSGQIATYSIKRNLIEANNGKISHPVTEATYKLDNFVSANDCYLAILGFNKPGTTMYDAVFCSGPHATDAATYYMRSVDPQIGALRPDRKIYSWGYYGGGGTEDVQFVNNLMFDLGTTEFLGDWVNVYRVKENLGKPLVNCTSSMWAVCGNYEFGLVHPSGKYVFLTQYDGPTTYIGRVDLSTKLITETTSIPYAIGQFSPNGRIVYASNSTSNEIRIYGFSVSSGQVTEGGTISLPSNLGVWLAAEWY